MKVGPASAGCSWPAPAGGNGRVIDTRTGKRSRELQVHHVDADTFVNDVILSKDAAWFTDSRQPVLYKVPLGRHGKLPAHGGQTVPLSGDYQHTRRATTRTGSPSPRTAGR